MCAISNICSKIPYMKIRIILRNYQIYLIVVHWNPRSNGAVFALHWGVEVLTCQRNIEHITLVLAR